MYSCNCSVYKLPSWLLLERTTFPAHYTLRKLVDLLYEVYPHWVGFPFSNKCLKQCGALLTAARSLKDPTLENEIPPGHIQRGRHTHCCKSKTDLQYGIFLFYLFIRFCIWENLEKKADTLWYDMIWVLVMVKIYCQLKNLIFNGWHFGT